MQAQDPQFSQYYAAPLYINPAFAGSETSPRFILNYRNQWPNLDANFETVSFSADYFIASANSGIGLIFTRDEATAAGYRSQNIGLQYAYELSLNDDYKMRVGMDVSYFMRDYQFYRFTFGDQLAIFEQTGVLPPVSQENGLDSRQYVNVSTGALLYSDKYWVGISAHNMNRPRQDILVNSDESRLPVRYDVQVGARFPLSRFEDWRDQYRPGYKEKSITTTLLYKKQGSFDQLDAGVYITYEPVVFGLWYRGLPIKTYRTGLTNNESLIALAGFRFGSMALGYSYDFTISAIGPNSGGAHELSLRYLLKTQPRYGQKRKLRGGLPCPKF
ncbi:MAG: hypothetical protein OHK0053_18570 [Microscillaceae bacterium]